MGLISMLSIASAQNSCITHSGEVPDHFGAYPLSSVDRVFALESTPNLEVLDIYSLPDIKLRQSNYLKLP